MVVRTNSLGEQQWLRVDSYKAPDGPALGANGWVARSSAAEWAVTTADGGIAIITDQVTGTGLIKMGGNNTAGGGTACTGTNCGNSGGGGGSGGNTGGSSGGDGKGDDSSGSLAAVHHWSAAGVAAVIASLAALL